MLERLKKSIDRGIVSVGVQSTTYLEIGKLRSRIGVLEDSIQQKKAEMGSGAYTYWKNGEDIAPYIEKISRDIWNLEQEIERHREKIAGLQAEKERVLSANDKVISTESVLCSCGEPNELGAKFCCACGKNLSSEMEMEGVCSACGAHMAAEARFCQSCGAARHGVEVTE